MLAGFRKVWPFPASPTLAHADEYAEYRRPCRFCFQVFVPAATSIVVSVDVPLSNLEYWDRAAQRYTVDAGAYTIYAAQHSDDLGLNATLALLSE